MNLTNQADRFQRVADAFGARLERLDETNRRNLSPCQPWTAQDLAVHVINETRRMAATVRGVDPSPVHGVLVADIGQLPEIDDEFDFVAAWKVVSADMTDAINDSTLHDRQLPTPGGPQSFASIIDALPEDVLIHTWDLARSIGADETLDQEAVAHVFEHLKPMDEMLRTPWAFGPKVTPPAGSDLQTQFLCFTGRIP